MNYAEATAENVKRFMKIPKDLECLIVSTLLSNVKLTLCGYS